MKRHLPPAAFLLMTVLAGSLVALPQGCAHVDPGKFAQCMQDSGKGAAFINAVRNILDSDNRTEVLEQLAISLTPAVVQCALEQIAASKGAGPVENKRALRAREYLDAHGGSASVFKRGGEVKLANRVGGLPHVVPAAVISRPEAPRADARGVHLAGICVGMWCGPVRG